MPSIKEDIYELIMEKERIWNQAVEEISKIDEKIKLLQIELLKE